MSSNVKQKGIMTLQSIIAMAIPLSACFGVYYGNIINTNSKINESEKELTHEINLNKNEITVNTTNIANIEKKLDTIDSKLDRLLGVKE